MFVALFFVALTVVGGHGSFDVHDLDWSIRPADNFFLFVNGRWLNKTSIPPSQTIVGGIFQTKHENNVKLKIILDDLLRNEDPRHPYPARSVHQQLADFYRAGLDTEAIEQTGLEPLRETLLELEQVSTYQELLVFVAKWYQEMNKDILFEFEVSPDSQNSSIYTIQWKVNRIDSTFSVSSALFSNRDVNFLPAPITSATIRSRRRSVEVKRITFISCSPWAILSWMSPLTWKMPKMFFP